MRYAFFHDQAYGRLFMLILLVAAPVNACGCHLIEYLICREAGREEVIYALDRLEEKIFIPKYKVKLPIEAKIKKVIRNV